MHTFFRQNYTCTPFFSISYDMYVTYMYLEPNFCLYFRSGQPSKTRPKCQSKQGSSEGVLGQQKLNTILAPKGWGRPDASGFQVLSLLLKPKPRRFSRVSEVPRAEAAPPTPPPPPRGVKPQEPKRGGS